MGTATIARTTYQIDRSNPNASTTFPRRDSAVRALRAFAWGDCLTVRRGGRECEVRKDTAGTFRVTEGQHYRPVADEAAGLTAERAVEVAEAFVSP